MKNTKLKNILYQASCIIILIGAIGFNFNPEYAKYILLVGVAGFAAITLTTPYPGKSIRGKRLYNMQIFAAILLIVSSVLMFSGYGFWVFTMLIAAILILYSSFIIPSVLKKESEDNK